MAWFGISEGPQFFSHANGRIQTDSYRYPSSYTNTGKYTPAHIAACVTCSPYL